MATVACMNRGYEMSECEICGKTPCLDPDQCERVAIKEQDDAPEPTPLQSEIPKLPSRPGH